VPNPSKFDTPERKAMCAKCPDGYSLFNIMDSGVYHCQKGPCPATMKDGRAARAM
jgi:hypothetical protein